MRLVLVIISISFLTSCYGWKYTDEVQDRGNSIKDEYIFDGSQEIPDEAGDKYDQPDDNEEYPQGCSLDSNWMEPEERWVSLAYVKMMGNVIESDGEYKPAVYVDGKINIKGRETKLTDGAFISFQNSWIYADALYYKFTNVDQNAGTAVVDYYNAKWQFSQQLIPLLKEEAQNEAGFGASIFFRHSFIYVEFNASGQVTFQLVRKNCLLAVSKIEEIEQFGEMYEVPIGNMFGCFEDNVDGSTGEKLKMMFKNELTDVQEDLIKALNTQDNGSILEYGDEGFKHICQCYDEEGNEVPCWEYDGPGGPEECPDYVPAAECEGQNSCDPNPCLEITGSDGVCAPDGKDFFCGCKENYKWDNENNLCNPETRLVDCSNTIPENSSYSGTGKYYQTWDGDSWEPAVSTCDWECDQGYSKSEFECLKTDDDSVSDDDVS